MLVLTRRDATGVDFLLPLPSTQTWRILAAVEYGNRAIVVVVVVVVVVVRQVSD